MKALQQIYHLAHQENIVVDRFALSSREALSIMDEDGACYIATGGLTVVTDFANQENWKQIPMPGGETVVDAFLRDGVIYTLAYAQNRNPSTHNVESYRTVIYKSTTGKEGSFQEVLSFDYTNTPMSFDWDGKHFYIGTGPSKESAKVGMVLRATPAA